jgi:hypothetical protein
MIQFVAPLVMDVADFCVWPGSINSNFSFADYYVA